MPARDVLGVRPGATGREVTDAFRRFAFRHHPDRGGDPGLFRAGVDQYHRLTRVGSLLSPRAEVVFHRRSRPGVATLVRTAARRLSSFRPH